MSPELRRSENEEIPIKVKSKFVVDRTSKPVKKKDIDNEV